MKRILITSAVAGSMSVLMANPAQADSTDDAIKSLKKSPVYVEQGANLTDAKAIESQLKGSDNAVAVFATTSSATYSPNSIASQLLDRLDGQYNTVIVIVDSAAGRDTVGAYSTKDATPILTAINTSLGGDSQGDAGQAIQASMATIKAETSTSVGHNGDGGGGAGAVVGVGGGLLALALVGVGGWMFVKNRMNRGAKVKAADVYYAQLPNELRKRLVAFKELIALHRESTDGMLVPQMEDILLRVQDLFARMDRKRVNGAEATGQKEMAAISYVNTFDKLNQALGRDLYLDMYANPTLWKNSATQLPAIRQAVQATEDQIVQNIREFNESQQLELNVALRSLTSSMDQPSVDDIFKN